MYALLSLFVLLAPVACRAGQDAEVRVVQLRPRIAQPGYSQLVVTGDEGHLVLFLRGGEDVTAILDDEVLPADRIVRDGDRVRIMSPEGETLFDVRVVSPDRDEVFGVGGRGASGPGFTLWRDAATVGSVGSRKLIGVTTTPVDAALAAQLGIDPEAAVVINEVSAGMPAEAAGVQPWDIVVKIDGEAPGTVDRLREVLRDKEEGQTVRLSLLRKGAPVELDVGFTQSRSGIVGGMAGETLRTALDRARAAEDVTVREALLLALDNRALEAEARQEALDQAQVRLETCVADLRDAEEAAREGPADSGGEARLKALRAEVERAQAEVAAATERLREGPMGPGFLDLGSEGGRALFVPPDFGGLPGTAGRDDESRQRIARLEEHLARLDAQMAERMERLEALIEKLVDVERQP